MARKDLAPLSSRLFGSEAVCKGSLNAGTFRNPSFQGLENCISTSGQARCSHETHAPFLGAILNYTLLCADQYLTVYTSVLCNYFLRPLYKPCFIRFPIPHVPPYTWFSSLLTIYRCKSSPRYSCSFTLSFHQSGFKQYQCTSWGQGLLL